jgi:UMP-CMP kinase
MRRRIVGVHRAASKSLAHTTFTNTTRDKSFTENNTVFFSVCLRWFASSSSSSSSSSTQREEGDNASSGIASKSSSSVVHCDLRRGGETSASSSSSHSTETTPTSGGKIRSTKIVDDDMTEEQPKKKKNNHVVFVLGGPGAGKGTQCANIVRDYNFTHLSAGDLLRAHMKSGTEDGNMVAQMIKDGKIVPSAVTVKLLLNAMADSKSNRFLIDGFPRNKENRDAWVSEAGYDCDFVLMYDCTEEVMLERLLGRNEGRTDDNVESIKKRFVTFRESSVPVVEFYETLGKVRKVDAIATPEEVYEKTKESFAQFE